MSQQCGSLYRVSWGQQEREENRNNLRSGADAPSLQDVITCCAHSTE